MKARKIVRNVVIQFATKFACQTHIRTLVVKNVKFWRLWKIMNTSKKHKMVFSLTFRKSSRRRFTNSWNWEFIRFRLNEEVSLYNTYFCLWHLVFVRRTGVRSWNWEFIFFSFYEEVSLYNMYFTLLFYQIEP